MRSTAVTSRAKSVALAVMLAAGLALTAPVSAGADEPDDPGKSSIVAECKKGGWTALAPEDDAGLPFRNQGECIQYVAQGGTAVATTGTPALPGGKKGCAASKAKATTQTEDAAGAEHPGKACKPRKAKSHAPSPSDDPSSLRGVSARSDTLRTCPPQRAVLPAAGSAAARCPKTRRSHSARDTWPLHPSGRPSVRRDGPPAVAVSAVRLTTRRAVPLGLDVRGLRVAPW